MVVSEIVGQGRLKCMFFKYGGYTHHLAALSEDSSVKSCDCAELRGYINWIEGKYLMVVLTLHHAPSSPK